MYLAVDVGNSNIVLGIYDGAWTHKYRYSSHEIQPEQFYLHGIQEVLLEWGIHPRSIQQVGISSVVPRLTPIAVDTLYQVIGRDVWTLGPATYAKMDMQVPLPYEYYH